MQASVKPESSYTWRSIAGARWVLKKGLRWTIGTGHMVRKWEDRWLPNNPTNKPITPKPVMTYESMVSEFINQETGKWDIQCL